MGATPPQIGVGSFYPSPSKGGARFQAEIGGILCPAPLLPKAVMTPHTLAAISPKRVRFGPPPNSPGGRRRRQIRRMGGRETPWECRLSAPHENWGAGMWGETPSGKTIGPS